MLPRLNIPDWRPPPDGEAGPWEEDTPREPREACRPAGSLPASPSARKTKSRAARSYVRSNSLRDAKVSQKAAAAARPVGNNLPTQTPAAVAPGAVQGICPTFPCSDCQSN